VFLSRFYLKRNILVSTGGYTQEGNKLNFLRNKNHFEKPQRGDINIAWGNAPGNPSYDHVEYKIYPAYRFEKVLDLFEKQA
jgi:hypothetical protein